jgi:hypothetical protein
MRVTRAVSCTDLNGLTGLGDILVLDDLIKADDVRSEVMRLEVDEWLVCPARSPTGATA